MKEMMKKILVALVITLTGLAIGGVTARAATGTITVTPPDGTTSDSETTYNLYKVFVARGDGTGISYNTVNVNDEIKRGATTVLHSKGWTVPDVKNPYEAINGTGTYDPQTVNHFILDGTGNVHWGTLEGGATLLGADSSYGRPANVAYDTQYINDQTEDLPHYAVEAIKTYIDDAKDQPIDTKTAKGTSQVEFTDVSNGYYYVTTTTGSLVAVNSANPNANITDKNKTPTLEKVITNVSQTGSSASVGSPSSDGTKAIAEAGSTVTYQVTVHFNDGAQNVILHDKLDDALRLSSTDPRIVYYGSNGSTVTASGENAATVRRNADGTSGNDDDPDAGDTLTIDFTKISPDNVSYATVSYSATVESDDLTSANPAKNAAYLTYGSHVSPAQTSKVETSVYNASYKVIKHDDADQPLANAGFVLIKRETNGSTTTDYYYKLTTTTEGSSTKKEVSWVTLTPETGKTTETLTREKADDGSVTRLTTAADGEITFTGLPDGNYVLYEVDVPSGYMRANDVSFTVLGAGSTNVDGEGNLIAFTAANLEQDTTVTNRPGSALPSTGGSGRTAVYIVGAGLLAGAVALAVVRRRLTA